MRNFIPEMKSRKHERKKRKLLKGKERKSKVISKKPRETNVIMKNEEKGKKGKKMYRNKVRYSASAGKGGRTVG